MRKLSLICSAALLALGVGQAAAQISSSGGVTTVVGSPSRGSADAISGPANARLPQASAAAVANLMSALGAPDGSIGASSASADGSAIIPGFTGGGVASQAYGTGAFPFTTKRSGSWALGPNAGVDGPVTNYPWRATGKLWARFGSNWFVCTASLVKPGVLITAAHCIHNYGRGAAGLTNLVYWYPAQYGGTFPYGIYRYVGLFLPTAYFNGTDTCDNAAIGIVCSNDLAVVILWANNQALAVDNQARAGNVVGWYGYGWNGYSHVTSPYLGNRFAAQLTQLGYPQAVDSGVRQIRTDSAGVYSADSTGVTSGTLEQTTWGSAQTGGSSGGPELVNFGTPPVHNAGSSEGTAAGQAVVGVTSWGFTNINVKVQGASHFGQNNQFPLASYGGYGAGNIGALVQAACTWRPSAC